MMACSGAAGGELAPVKGDVGEEDGEERDEDDRQRGVGGSHVEVGGGEIWDAEGDEGEGHRVGTDHPLAVLDDMWAR